MSARPDRLRAGRETTTGSAHAKMSLRTLLRLVDGDRDDTRNSRSDDAEGTTSQANASQIVVSTQYQHQHMYEAYQPQYEQAHHQEGEAQGEVRRGRLDLKLFLGVLLTCRSYRISANTYRSKYNYLI